MLTASSVALGACGDDPVVPEDSLEQETTSELGTWVAAGSQVTFDGDDDALDFCQEGDTLMLQFAEAGGSPMSVFRLVR